MKEVKKSINRAIKNLRMNISGIISSVTRDGRIFLNTYSDEEIRDIIICTPYGLKSLPLGGEDATIIMNNTSNNAAMVGINFNDKIIQIDIGETLLYNAKANTYIHLKNDGKIYIKGQIINTL